MEYSDSTQDSVSVLASVKIHLPSPTGYVYEESVLMSITRLISEFPLDPISVNCWNSWFYQLDCKGW